LDTEGKRAGGFKKREAILIVLDCVLKDGAIGGCHALVIMKVIR